MLDVPGETIVKKGAIGHAIYFNSSGYVEVEVLPTLVRLGSRDFFGEIALIKKYPRTFSVKAFAFCDLLVMSASDFKLFLDNNPEIRKTLSETAEKKLKWVACVDASSLLQISNCTHAPIRAFV